jgi:N-acetylmuramoyl-L-alanine amidase
VSGRVLRTAFLCVLGLALLGVKRPQGLGDVIEVRHWSYPGYTRVVVELNRSVHTEVRRLAADPAAQRPERLYLDLAGVWVGRSYEEGVDVSDGLLQGVRLGQFTLQTTRVVLDLERYQRHRLLELSHPHRVVIDVYGPEGDPEPERWTEQAKRGDLGPLPTGMRPVHTVVVDAGHGGRDPGAIGVGGLREKDVTLKLARLVGTRLEKKGFEVVYTRDKDRTLSLEERTAIAESVRGDLFVSLHANAARRRSVHGIETYYLDQDHNRHTLNLAARENGIKRNQVNELQHILAKLHIEELSPHSQRLAALVQRQMVMGVPGRERPLDLGVKRGPFHVLFLSNMPAILVEAGFLTNRSDAKLLRDTTYVEALADQIVTGVEEYRGGTDATLAQRGSE